MKIVLSNYRYFISGGPERYLFSIKDVLEQNHIEVFPFSVKSRHNEYSEWENYFLAPLSSNDSAYFEDYKKDFSTIVKMIERLFYSPEAFLRARKYAKIIKPDLVYSLHFLNKMSPSVIDGFKSCGLPIVVRLSDFGLICPQAHLFRGDAVCEECITASYFSAIKKKCVHNSMTGSLLKALAWNLHRVIGSINRIDAFVSPSKFTIEKYIEAGFPPKKFFYIPTFIDGSQIIPTHSDSGYILYFGRLIKEKGVHILLEAYSKLKGIKPKLLVIGDIHNSEYTKELVKKFSMSVNFFDFMPKAKLIKYIHGAKFIVIPSVWYENLPNVLLESFACGKAVIASNHGCLKDFIIDRENGLLFSQSNVDDLTDKIDWAIKNPETIKQMGKRAREYIETFHKPENHLNSLMTLFSSLMEKSNNI